MVVKRKGCGVIRAEKFVIFDFEYKVRWYLIESLVSRIFKIFSRGFYDHGEFFKDRPRGDFLRLNSKDQTDFFKIVVTFFNDCDLF